VLAAVEDLVFGVGEDGRIEAAEELAEDEEIADGLGAGRLFCVVG
jgi:hypothetical protein